MRRLKYIALFIAILTANIVAAQGLFDVQQFSVQDINGTARYMGMVGAFNALGGEASAINSNPAALGVYQNTEITFSLNFNPSNSISDWKGTTQAANRFRVNVNNLAFVLTLKSKKSSGYLYSNFNFSHHRAANFNRRVNAVNTEFNNSIGNYMAAFTNGASLGSIAHENAYDNVTIGWLGILASDAYAITGDGSWSATSPRNPNATYQLNERGAVDDYNFSYAFNINNQFYFGVGVSLLAANIRREMRFNEVGTSYSLDFYNNILTTGAGWNFRVGAIFRPTDFIRIGAAYTTPTYYAMTDSYYATARSITNTQEMRTPDGLLDYYLRTPMKVDLGVGFIIGERAALDIDYTFTRTKNTKLGETNLVNGSLLYGDNYEPDNAHINEHSLNTHMLKVGAEIMAIEDILPVRVGVAYRSALIDNYALRNDPLNGTHCATDSYIDKGTWFASTGIGYYKSFFGIDAAYLMKMNKSTMLPFAMDHSQGAKVKSFSHNAVVTLSFRF